MKKVDYDTRRRLSLHHWPSILSLYNISLTGYYITLLPPINLIHTISREVAISLRNPEEKGIRFRWQSLAAALDPIDFPGKFASRVMAKVWEIFLFFYFFDDDRCREHYEKHYSR